MSEDPKTVIVARVVTLKPVFRPLIIVATTMLLALLGYYYFSISRSSAVGIGIAGVALGALVRIFRAKPSCALCLAGVRAGDIMCKRCNATLVRHEELAELPAP